MKIHSFSVKPWVPLNAAQYAMRGANALLLCAALLPGALHAQEISPAEKILFQSNHLQNVASVRALRYNYVRKDGAGPGFTDQVQVDISARNADGSASVSSHFLNGERQIALPALTDAQGNPALLGFLERDINEMKRLTGGSASYFRKRIRIALAEAASVEAVSVSYAGRQVAGRKIVIAPYLHDPMREKMQKYLAKKYVFILSDAIPGSVYQIRSTVSGAQQGELKNGEVLIEETMTLAGPNGSP